MTSAEDRELIGQAWLEQALGEHASVAAFARLVLHLMSLGAPADLVRESIRAMDDEVRHAQICFNIARQFRGKPASPGPLDLSRVLAQPSDLTSILEAAIVEGCVNETIAARYVKVSSTLVDDPMLRDALSGIADDEARHAELSWNLVRWLLKSHGNEYLLIAKRCFAHAKAEPAVNLQENLPQWIEKYGQLLQKTKEEIRLWTWSHEIVPRMRMIFEPLDDLPDWSLAGPTKL